MHHLDLQMHKKFIMFCILALTGIFFHLTFTSHILNIMDSGSDFKQNKTNGHIDKSKCKKNCQSLGNSLRKS